MNIKIHVQFDVGPFEKEKKIPLITIGEQRELS